MYIYIWKVVASFKGISANQTMENYRYTHISEPLLFPANITLHLAMQAGVAIYMTTIGIVVIRRIVFLQVGNRSII